MSQWPPLSCWMPSNWELMSWKRMAWRSFAVASVPSSSTQTVKFIANAIQQFWFVYGETFRHNINLLVDPRSANYFQSCKLRSSSIRENPRWQKPRQDNKRFCVNSSVQVFQVFFPTSLIGRFNVIPRLQVGPKSFWHIWK